MEIIKPKRFMLETSAKTLDVFDSLCEYSHVDRSAGFSCLMIDFFAGNLYMQNQMGHPHYMYWKERTRDFLINHCP